MSTCSDICFVCLQEYWGKWKLKRLLGCSQGKEDMILCVPKTMQTIHTCMVAKTQQKTTSRGSVSSYLAYGGLFFDVMFCFCVVCFFVCVFQAGCLSAFPLLHFCRGFLRLLLTCLVLAAWPVPLRQVFHIAFLYVCM